MLAFEVKDATGFMILPQPKWDLFFFKGSSDMY